MSKDTQYLGSIGSRKYPMTKETHLHFLTYMLGRVMGADGKIETQHYMVSGHCLGSPDMWAEHFLKKFGLQPKIFPAKDYNYNYRYRNGLIAQWSDSLVAFIKRGQVQSGAWNTVSQYLDLGKTDVVVLDEHGEPWMQKWAQVKLDRNLARKTRNAPLTVQTSLIF